MERAQSQATSRDSDEPLIDRFLKGDMAAFDELVRKYQRPLYGLAMRYVRDADDAKDVSQKAFVRAFESLSKFRQASTFRTWLYRITVNLALNHVRDRKPNDPVAAEQLAAEPCVYERASEKESKQRLRAALESLPQKQRLVVELRIYEELPFCEVAEIAGCSENAAKVNFHHAVKKLREAMGGCRESK
ncbi:MAG: sigma-70 family RNA polymerase sigma factor [Deltaproteobacteria bacterium]|nr:sigma-70 family RNA polymerase sigma factor [Deltaproteobacteria bacterium]